ncbi:acetyltransferase [Mycolicibacterium thermoresistibile]
MSTRIAPLRLEAFDQLPKHARRCVFWEVDPSTVPGDDHLADPEFEKEAWLSMVMLEWGSCGQLAMRPRRRTGNATTADGDDEHCLGYAFYAPPGVVPRARLFPSGPVSADAVLLTSVGVEPGPDSDATPRGLLAAVVGDLVRRGVRALEAFGRTAEVGDLTDPHRAPADLRQVVEVLGDCSADQCVIAVDVLEEVGFEVVTPHRYFPRLRLELEQGLGWKADVEAALERLFDEVRLEQPVGAGAGRGL